MSDAVVAGRWQFAFTIMFHYLFPVLTMGLGVLIAVLKTMQLLRRDGLRRAARFWAKIFAVTFAAWGSSPASRWSSSSAPTGRRFSHFAGGVVGQTLFMEGVFAFFAESSFLGVFLFGERRVRTGPALAVGGDGGRSAPSCRASSSSPPTRGCSIPVAYQMVERARGTHEPLGRCCRTRTSLWQYPHVISGSLVAGVDGDGRRRRLLSARRAGSRRRDGCR